MSLSRTSINSVGSVTLAQVKSGERVRFKLVHGGRGLRGRLTAMGLIPEIELTVLSNGFRGPIMISMGMDRLTIGRSISEKIVVEPC